MTVLNVRNIDPRTVDRLKRIASARGWTLAKCIEQLVSLHDAARARADAGDDALQAELTALGLQTVTG